MFASLARVALDVWNGCLPHAIRGRARTRAMHITYICMHWTQSREYGARTMFFFLHTRRPEAGGADAHGSSHIFDKVRIPGAFDGNGYAFVTFDVAHYDGCAWRIRLNSLHIKFVLNLVVHLYGFNA